MRPDTTSSADAGWPDTSVALEVEEEPDVGALLNKATTRQSCNIVMGCPAGATLIALGEDAVAPIIARYQSMGRPNYQKFHLLDLLGHIGSESALPLLRDELDASHWESRTRSALALGRIGSRRDLARLKTLLVKTENTQDYAFRYALACAVEKLAGEGGAEVLFEGLSPQAINSRNWGYTRVAVEAVAELELTSACPLLRVAVEHRDTFLKKAAMLATGALRCSDPALTQAVAAQLPSRVPSVRRQATATLRILTGITFSDYEQWQSYDRQN
jgi:HEAT repeat protein